MAAGTEAALQSDLPVALGLETAAIGQGKDSALEGVTGAAVVPSLWDRLTPKKWKAAAASQQGTPAEGAAVVDSAAVAAARGGGGGAAGKLSFVRRSLLLGAGAASSSEQVFAATGQLSGSAASLNTAKGGIREALGQAQHEQYIAAAAVAEGVMEDCFSSKTSTSAVDLFLQQEGCYSPAVKFNAPQQQQSGLSMSGAESGMLSSHGLGWRAHRLKYSKQM